jgi:hypothetical protein
MGSDWIPVATLCEVVFLAGPELRSCELLLLNVAGLGLWNSFPKIQILPLESAQALLASG